MLTRQFQMPATAEASLSTATSNSESVGEPIGAGAATTIPGASSTDHPRSSDEIIIISCSIAAVIMLGVAVFLLLRRCNATRGSRMRIEIEVEKDAAETQIYEKDSSADRTKSVNWEKTELNGSEAVHQMFHELESPIIQTDSKGLLGSPDLFDHPAKR